MPDDPSALGWRDETVLIIGRASPEPSRKHIETVCTAGITEKGEVLRLYPIPLRYLESGSKYKLWTWAKFTVQKNPADKRKESHRVKEGSIQILSEVQNRSEQFSFLEKAIFPDREILNDRYHQDWTSVGVVEIELIDFSAKPRKKIWETEKPYIRQSHLYTERKPLEQLPFEMRIAFKCKNNNDCRGHTSGLIGWQYLEAFRNFREKYGSDENAFDMLKHKVISSFGDDHKRSFALMGTHSRYASWMVAELYFFDKNLAARLF